MRLSRRGPEMPYNQINTPARRLVTTAMPERPDPDNPGTFIEGNGLPEGHTAFGWAQPGDILHDGEHWENTPTLFVGWSSGPISGSPDAAVPGDSSLQFTMEVDVNEVLRAAAEIERNRKLNAEGAGVGELITWGFSTVVIHRPEAQMLIRTAKRARDAVFGADE